MSANEDLEEASNNMMMYCAACGIAGTDDIKLKKCTACKSVRYCGVKCQKDHRPKHKNECKKRAAELRDKILFKQPESTHMGDCPICCLPLSHDPQKSALKVCCCTVICIGCEYANKRREFEGKFEHKCPFCRHPGPKTHEEAEVNLMRRIEVNDPSALYQMGTSRRNEGNYKSASEYLSKAAELGDATAHYNLSVMYREGEGVEKDEKKELRHLEEAAIIGHPFARHVLGVTEQRKGRRNRAVKHWMIAAKLGEDDSLENVKMAYRCGLVSKDDLASALRAYQAAIDATKSPQRDEVEAACKGLGLGSRFLSNS